VGLLEGGKKDQVLWATRTCGEGHQVRGGTWRHHEQKKGNTRGKRKADHVFWTPLKGGKSKASWLTGEKSKRVDKADSKRSKQGSKRFFRSPNFRRQKKKGGLA